MKPQKIYTFLDTIGYLTTGRVNIRICRENGPPKRPAGKQDVVWGGLKFLRL